MTLRVRQMKWMKWAMTMSKFSHLDMNRMRFVVCSLVLWCFDNAPVCHLLQRISGQSTRKGITCIVVVVGWLVVWLIVCLFFSCVVYVSERMLVIWAHTCNIRMWVYWVCVFVCVRESVRCIDGRQGIFGRKEKEFSMTIVGCHLLPNKPSFGACCTHCMKKTDRLWANSDTSLWFAYLTCRSMCAAFKRIFSVIYLNITPLYMALYAFNVLNRVQFNSERVEIFVDQNRLHKLQLPVSLSLSFFCHHFLMMPKSPNTRIECWW